ncbi:MAG: alpha-amylase family glycosyl hydrolase [Chloroflexota bacterium]|nr:alpha-amylase family glycosyl hydrolase [Chloroflexota bacterium]
MSEQQGDSNAVMEDFVFGRLEADDNTLEAIRRRWCGIRHQHDIDPLDPMPGQPVTISVSAGRDVLVDRVTAYVTTDGSDPAGSQGDAIHGLAIPLHRVETQWQPSFWDYSDLWRGTIPGQPEGSQVRYRIEGWHSQDPAISHWSREMNIDGTIERPTLYGYSVDRFKTPAWAQEAILYQVFVDRFAPVGSRWLEPAEMEQFSGGNLRGVIDHLDYIADLGVTAIWLTPVFATTSYHGYDTVDYFRVDPRFGSNEDLAELVREAHRRNLRIVLDFVTNHTSDEFVPFQEALQDFDSPYRSWYSFGPEYMHGYRTFFTARNMPQIDLDNPGARAYMLEAARFWLTEYHVDGYRLDYAAGPSHDFWSAFGAHCKEIDPECWVFGEVTLGSDALRTYSGRLDGCLDFGFTRLVRRIVGSRNPEEDPISWLATSLERTQRFFPAGFSRPTFLDNHDMNRFLWMVGDDKRRLRLAVGLLMAFGGTPVLYYGTEVGLSQPRSKGPWREEARHPMLWGASQDKELLADFKSLIRFRRRHRALVYGEIVTLALDDARGLWLAEKAFKQDRVLIAVNAGALQGELELPDGVFFDADGSACTGTIAVPSRTVMMFSA